MNHKAVLLVALVVCAGASAADEQRYQLKEDSKLFGFTFGHTLNNAEFVLPFDKSYAELTTAQQARLKSAYKEMGGDDEPPFPIGGLKAIYDPITEGQQHLRASGIFRADVEVDEQGDPLSIAIYRSPNKWVTQFVAKIVMLAKFKPALCAGMPCKMRFPVGITFIMR